MRRAIVASDCSIGTNSEEAVAVDNFPTGRRQGLTTSTSFRTTGIPAFRRRGSTSLTSF